MFIVAHNGARIWGGAERALTQLLAGLQRRGHRVLLLCNDPVVAGPARALGVSAEILPLGGDVAVHHAVRLARRLAEMRPDALLVGLFKKVWLAGLAGRLAGVPRTWSVRESFAATRTLMHESARLSFRGPATQILPLAPQVAGPRNLPSVAWRVDAAARTDAADSTEPDEACRAGAASTRPPKGHQHPTVDSSVARQPHGSRRMSGGCSLGMTDWRIEAVEERASIQGAHARNHRNHKRLRATEGSPSGRARPAVGSCSRPSVGRARSFTRRQIPWLQAGCGAAPPSGSQTLVDGLATPSESNPMRRRCGQKPLTHSRTSALTH